MMDDVQTGNDTLQVVVLGGTSTFDDPDVTTDGDVNPDYTADDVAVYFTGDMNLSGTRVLETSQGADGYQDAYTGNTYYRWSTHTVQNGDGDSSWNQNCVNASCDDAPSAWTYTNTNNTYNGSSRSVINLSLIHI